ncbi:hypothetical protein RX330_20455 [Bradyrhizobium sp. NDS-1]|uniref:hypothetical protein n=1 Tax=Bradyrhizobium sp. NDS-1 TaxID=3080014 RepID=UPI00293EA1A6|nr:hypothetical protein [Bradyrhizobium sp. NDS-1]WOH70671.1 hypothetical protein RX330_20455 [Bradyrhizobium sp. NDS-1]
MRHGDSGELTDLALAICSAAVEKAAAGLILLRDDVTADLAAFVATYDFYVAAWPQGDALRFLVIRYAMKEGEDFRGNAAFVQDRATAIALHEACRANDNIAPAVADADAMVALYKAVPAGCA